MYRSPKSFICLATILFIFIQHSSSAEKTLTLVDFGSTVKRENTQYGLLPPVDQPLHRSRRQADEAKELVDKFKKPFNTTEPPEFPEEISNEQLEKFNRNNASSFTDHYTYYNVTYINQPGTVDQYWVNMKDNKDSIRHEMLSSAHRRAATVRLSFKFPFYGYKVENITIATGGFLFLGEAVHTWLVVCLPIKLFLVE